MKKIHVVFLGILLLLIVSPNAFASYMGFSNISISGSTGTLAGTGDFEGIDITFTASGGNLTWNGNDLGVGVNDDEITLGQSIEVSFSEPVFLNQFFLVDLFAVDQGTTFWEQGGYYINGQAANDVIFGDENNDTFGGEGPEQGRLALDLNQSLNSITFFGVPTGSHSGSYNNDFALQGFNGSPNTVPEPATVLLLGFGLAGLAGYRRIRNPSA